MKKLLLLLNFLLMPITVFAGQNVTGNLYVSGNVGIGTTAPTVKLDVAGTVKALNYMGQAINTNSEVYDSNINSYNLDLGMGSDSFISLRKTEHNQWHCHPNDIDIDTMGKARFGDGYSYGTGTRLEVHDAESRLVLNNYAGLTTIGDYDNGAYHTVFIVDAPNKYFFFRSGLMYIGDDDRDIPAAKLHIQGGTEDIPPFMLSTGTNTTAPMTGAMEYDGTELYFTPISTRETIAYISDLDDYVPYTGASTNVDLGANNLTIDTTTMFVDASANAVGIGTSSPNSSVALEVGAPSSGKNMRVTATLGTELAPALTTGNWTLGTGWAYLTSPNRLSKNADGTGTATPTAATTIVAGNTYRVVIVVDSISGSTANVTLGGTYGTNLIAATTYSMDIVASSTAKLIISPLATGLRINISSISIEQITTTTGLLTVDGNVSTNTLYVGRDRAFGASNNYVGNAVTILGNVGIGSKALNTSAGINFWSLPYYGSAPDAHLTVNNYLLEFGNDIALGNSYTEKIRMAAGNFTHSSAQGTFFNVTGSVTDSSTGGYTGMKINITENSTGSGANNLLALQVGSVNKATISNIGGAYFAGNVGIGSATPRATLEVDGNIYNFKSNCDQLCRTGGFFGCKDTGTCVAD